jgi:hypothetical protein
MIVATAFASSALVGAKEYVVREMAHGVFFRKARIIGAADI